MIETLPEGWRSVPFWSLFYRDKQIGFPEEELLSVYREYGVIRKEDRDDNHNRAGDDLASYQLVEPGDLVLNKMKTWQGSLGISGYRGIVSPAYFVYKSRNSESSEFLHYALRSRYYVTQYASFSKGVRPSQWDLQPEYLSMMRVLLPPLSTQKSIVKYLAQETGEIDAMLATLDELRETLRLRRVQVIQSAVRSSRSIGIGLMLDVKLGKMLQTKPKSPTDRLQPYLRAAHIQPGGQLDLAIDTKEMYFSERESETLSLRAGDAVIVEGGSIGRAAYLTEDMPGWGFQNSIIRLRGASADTRYAVYALQAALESGEIAMVCNSATFAHFTVEKVESFRIPFHGRDKHERIAEHLDEVTGRIDAMLAKIDELKALLVERRAALITDVVTGRKKIPS